LRNFYCHMESSLILSSAVSILLKRSLKTLFLLVVFCFCHFLFS
jgi:hypothetical protein